MSQPSKKQRVRGKNFSIQEIEILKDEVMVNIDVINAKHCNGASGVTKSMQERVWWGIVKRINAVGVAERSVTDIKEEWRNFVKMAKAEMAQTQYSMSMTGTWGSSAA